MDRKGDGNGLNREDRRDEKEDESVEEKPGTGGTNPDPELSKGSLGQDEGEVEPEDDNQSGREREGQERQKERDPGRAQALPFPSGLPTPGTRAIGPWT